MPASDRGGLLGAQRPVPTTRRRLAPAVVAATVGLAVVGAAGAAAAGALGPDDTPATAPGHGAQGDATRGSDHRPLRPGHQPQPRSSDEQRDQPSDQQQRQPAGQETSGTDQQALPGVAPGTGQAPAGSSHGS